MNFGKLFKKAMPLVDPLDLLGQQKQKKVGDPSDGWDAKTQAQLQAIIDSYDKIENPVYDKSDPTLYQSAGDLSLKGLEGDYTQGDTRIAGIEQDQRLTGVQSAALQRLSEMAEGDGFTAEDRARLDKAQDDVATADRGRRESIMQNMAARGMSGSGNELLAMLQSNQAATERQNDASLNVAAQGNQRALQALMNSSDLARRMDQDRLGLETRKAEAQDSINRFNQGQMLARDQYNAGTHNTAQQANWQNNQNIANANTGLQNDHRRYTNDLAQQQFQNDMAKTQGKNQGRQGMADFGWKKGTAAAKAHAQPKPGNPLMGIAGAGIGGFFGGPAGASVGYQAGNALSRYKNRK